MSFRGTVILGYLCDQPHAGCRPKGQGHHLTSAAHFTSRRTPLSNGNRGMKDNIGIHLYHEKKYTLLTESLKGNVPQCTYPKQVIPKHMFLIEDSFETVVLNSI